MYLLSLNIISAFRSKKKKTVNFLLRPINVRKLIKTVIIIAIIKKSFETTNVDKNFDLSDNSNITALLS